MRLDMAQICAWLNRRRLFAASGFLLALEVAIFVFLIAGTHGLIVPLDRPTTTDFASFYAAGSLADAGTPELAYDQSAHFAAEQQATEPGIEYQFFFYPPVFLLLCALLAKLPYLPAFYVFEAATLIPYLFVARQIIREKGWAVFIPLLAFPSVFWTLGLGQNAFMTAALFGSALLLIDRRPVVSGILFGLLCYKPHFGLLIPIALVAAGRWRAFSAAGVAVGALVALSVALFGWQTWQDFFALFGGSHSTYESGRIDFAGFVSLFGGARLMGIDPNIAYIVQTILTVTAMATVAFVWRCNLSLTTRAATLAAATLVAIPVVLIYDLMTAAIAIAWLVRSANENALPHWEKLALLVIFLVPLVSRNLGTDFHVPLAPLAAVGLFGIAVTHACREVAVRSNLAPISLLRAFMRGHRAFPPLQLSNQ